MKTFVFIPDTHIGAGFGHLRRCYQFSNFINKKNKIIFLINKKFNKNYLPKKNNSKLINYFFYDDLITTLGEIKLRYKSIYTVLDSYNRKLHSINLKNYSVINIKILDFKIKSKSDYIIDHTFKRNKNFHLINSGSKILTGVNYFPINGVVKNKKRDIVLINFGSVNNKSLIINSLKIVDNLNLNFIKKVVVINSFFKKENIPELKIKKKVSILKYTNNINLYYQRSFFSIGACGISLYEKCFFHVPSISKCVAKNQSFNYSNFLSSNYIINFDKILLLDLNNETQRLKLIKSIEKLKDNLKVKFQYKINKNKLIKFFKNL
tara:strand:- start:1348 stop:2310 length:963 start_codon:yes stop_codon:yes gene_type:complete